MPRARRGAPAACARSGSTTLMRTALPGTGSPGSLSASVRVPRIATSDRWRRDLTVPTGIPIATAISVRGIPRKKCWTTIARHSGSSRLSASSSCSRSAMPADSSPTDGIRMGVSSTSIDRRRRRLATSMQALTVSLRSQASNRSGSRNPGRSRQARTMASWTASRASSPSRRIRRAAPSSRATAAPASAAKASWSPRFARMTRSRWSTVAPQ